MEEVSLPDGKVISDWPIVDARDYVNAVVFDEQGRALILDGYKHGMRRCGWQVVGGYVETDENPLRAVERELLEETGYKAEEWRYLGSFVVDPNRRVGVGHFFLALNARAVSEPANGDLEESTLRLVSFDELRYALVDGRLGVISYALNVMLAFMALEKMGRNEEALAYLRSHSRGLDASA
ncbi:MAG: NUDIX hydrolase [Candidatus Promineifilaceae bacterium]|nr:NUDIX hydrolase [Candidatus Promineifilaceae bacterium]